MALPKLPSLLEVIENPRVVASLPTPMMQEVLNRLKHLAAMVEGASDLPPDPISLAIAHPRYRFLDTRHLHYLGEEVADTIETAGHRIVCMPPRHGKTTTCSIWSPFWALARNPTIHIIFVSYESKFARRWGMRVRTLIETYGERYGLKLNPKMMSAEDWELTTGGGMYCTGVGGGIAGRPADLFIFDDLIKNEEEAGSDVIRDKTWEWWDMNAVQRIEPQTAVFGIGTRWHEDDIIGRLIKASDNGEGIQFDVISIPALAEDDDPLGRLEGEGLWLEKYPQEWYEQKRDTMSPYAWGALYQQHPSPPGGNKVDPAWWRFYRPSELPATFDQEVQSWDLSLDAEKKRDSYHCGGVGSRKGALVYIRDAFHEHCQAPRVITQIRTWHDVYPKARTKLVERSLAGPWLIQTLRSELPGLTPWPPKGKRKGSKEAALDACVPYIRSGNVLLPLNPDGTKPRWVQELIEECRQFPNASHDDYVDMLSQMMNFMFPGARRAVDQAQREAQQFRVHQDPATVHTATIHQLIARLAKPKLDAMREMARRQESAVIPFGRGVSTALTMGRRAGGGSRTGRRLW